MSAVGRILFTAPGALAARIDALSVLAVTRELGPYWCKEDLVGRLRANVETFSRFGEIVFYLYLDNKVILRESLAHSASEQW